MNNHRNTKLSSKHEPPLSNTDSITLLGNRLRVALKDLSQRELAKSCGLSHITIGAYINGKQYPRINDLANFANVTNTDLVWLITGQRYTEAHWLTSKQSIELCPDNCMIPTITPQTPVLIEVLDVDWPIPNGVYCLESAQGRIVRRLQWDEEKQGFWLRCDNLHFEPQFDQTPNIIGKVVGALAPVI